MSAPKTNPEISEMEIVEIKELAAAALKEDLGDVAVANVGSGASGGVESGASGRSGAGASGGSGGGSGASANVGDATSSIIPKETRAEGRIITNEDGVLAGATITEEVFRQVSPEVSLEWQKKEGEHISKGEALLKLAGPLKHICTAERTALNFLGHLCGIASLTRKFTQLVDGSGAIISDTRKTTPLLRRLEKSAVRVGGGKNHRMNLSEAVMIKDNHLKAMGIKEAVREARKLGLTVQVECDSHEQVLEACEAAADSVLLDNMSPDEVKRCVETIGGRCKTEASGGINLNNISDYSKTGVDVISIGALTNKSQSLDLSLEIETTETQQT